MKMNKILHGVLCSLFALLLCHYGHASDFKPELGKVKRPELPWTRDTILQGIACPKELSVHPPVIEDPDWYFPRPGAHERKPEYGGRSGLGSSYLVVLEEALKGNPVAMADLVIRIQYGADHLAAALPQFPKEMHTIKFWMEWMARYTSPGWAYAEISKYNEGIGSTTSALGTGAKLGDPKSMYLYSKESACSEKRRWIILAANAGYGPAARRLSGLYRYGDVHTGYQILQSTEKMNLYLELAKSRGYAWAFIDSAHDSYHGLHGKESNLEDMYYNCQLFDALIDTHHGFMLIDRKIPQLMPTNGFELRSCISKVAEPTRSKTPEEEARQKFTPQQRDALMPSAEIIHAADKRAYAWLSMHKAMREAELASERIRRKELTKQLRVICAPAIAEIEKLKKAK